MASIAIRSIALIDYQTEPISETATVVNPDYRRLESQIKSKAAILARRRARFGALSLDEDLSAATIASYERQKGDLKEEIDTLAADLCALKEKRKATSNGFGESATSRWVIFPKTSDSPNWRRPGNRRIRRIRFVDTIRMVAYRAETALAIVVREALARGDDARSLLRELFDTEACDAKHRPHPERDRAHANGSSPSPGQLPFGQSRAFPGREFDGHPSDPEGRQYPGTDLRLDSGPHEASSLRPDAPAPPATTPTTHPTAWPGRSPRTSARGPAFATPRPPARSGPSVPELRLVAAQKQAARGLFRDSGTSALKQLCATASRVTDQNVRIQRGGRFDRSQQVGIQQQQSNEPSSGGRPDFVRSLQRRVE